jgi:hypothetical protein
MSNRKDGGTTVATEQRETEMPIGEMAEPPGPTTEMPTGDMPGEEASAFVTATGDMPGRGEMGDPAAGVLAGLAAGLGATALAEMPGGDMGPAQVAAAATTESTITIEGTWRLHLTSSAFTRDDT